MKCFNLKYLVPLAVVLLLLGCYQDLDDPDNAIVSGYVYECAVAGGDTLYGEGYYTEAEFYNPVESVHVWIESDIESEIPYMGPDVDGYTDANGFFSIPVYLGHTERLSSYHVVDYDYVYYADVSVFWVYKGMLFYDFGGGITLGRGKEFRLFETTLLWGSEAGD